MKSQMNFKVIGMITTLMFVLASFSVNTVNAQTTLVSAPVSTEAKPELQVKFLGAAGEFLYFELAMQQANDTRSNLRIRNENGNELYAETVFSKSSVRKMKIAKDEAEKIEFVYNTARGEVRKVVEIKIRLQEAIEVKDVSKL